MVMGGLFGEAKGSFLKIESCDIYIGDHIGDIVGAKAGGCTSVAVATGPISKEDLAKESPDVLLDDLTQFPQWLTGTIETTNRDQGISTSTGTGIVLWVGGTSALARSYFAASRSVNSVVTDAVVTNAKEHFRFPGGTHERFILAGCEDPGR